MMLGARPVLLAPRPPPPPPSLAAMERFARLETFRRARAHRRSEMRRPLSERRAERAALAKAEMRARRSAKAARERRLNRVHEAAEILRFAMSMARATKREARLDERHARFLKQEARHLRSQERRWIHSYIGEKELEWKQWDYFPNGCPYVLEEARMAEALAGESRKLADEAGDFLRKAREAVSGTPGAMQRLRRGGKRFFNWWNGCGRSKRRKSTRPSSSAGRTQCLPSNWVVPVRHGNDVRRTEPTTAAEFTEQTPLNWV